MKLLSVNVSEPKPLIYNDKIVLSAIFKKPVTGRVMLRTLNIEGDVQGDRSNHGGPYKAAYAYDIENYEFWKTELGRDDFTFGQFGENLTTEGMADDKVHIGDVFRIGGAVVEACQPRNPCYKLGVRMGSADFVSRFLESCLLGIYLRVIEEGEIGAGDAIERIETGPERITVREMARLRNYGNDDLGLTRKALQIPALPPNLHLELKRRLEKAGVPSDA